MVVYMARPMKKEVERVAREEHMLDVVDDLLARAGYLGFTMNQVAQEIGYSKGTIYQHFSSKEDMLLALVCRQKARYAQMFSRAASFSGRPRECMSGVGLADRILRRLRPRHTDDEEFLHQPSIWDKTCQSWRDKFHDAELICGQSMYTIMAQAVAQGDLDVPPEAMSRIILGVRSMSIGVHLLRARDNGKWNLSEDLLELHEMQHAYLDSFQWRPLSTEWDYSATEQRLLTEVFPREGAEAGFIS